MKYYLMIDSQDLTRHGGGAMIHAGNHTSSASSTTTRLQLFDGRVLVPGIRCGKDGSLSDDHMLTVIAPVENRKVIRLLSETVAYFVFACRLKIKGTSRPPLRYELSTLRACRCLPSPC